MHTKFNSLSPSSHPKFTCHTLSDDLSEIEAAEKDLLLLISHINKKCREPFRECFTSLVSDVSKEAVACLICDPVYDFTQSVAESLKIPRMMLRTGSASFTAVVSAFPHLQEKGYIPRLDSRLEEQVAEFSPLRVKDLPLINSSDKDRFFKLVYNLNYQTKTSCGFILNTFEDLEQNAQAKLREEFHVPVFPIGPFHKCVPATSSLVSQDHQSCISWLNSNAQRSVIYVSFGSIVTLDQAQFLEIAWGLSNSKQPFLWVVRPGLVHGSSWIEHLPRGFLEALNGRGHIVKWAPQKEVVAHQSVGVFWTHCGWNSTLEGICEGVPMICTPFFGDQMLNARYACDVWEAGLQLKMERGEIERGIESLMIKKEEEQMKDRLSKLKEKASLCLRQGGSSYQALNDLVDHILSLETLATSHKNE